MRKSKSLISILFIAAISCMSTSGSVIAKGANSDIQSGNHCPWREPWKCRNDI